MVTKRPDPVGECSGGEPGEAGHPRPGEGTSGHPSADPVEVERCGDGNVLEVYVGYLRNKTEAGGEPRLIQTVRGVGYVIRDV